MTKTKQMKVTRFLIGDHADTDRAEGANWPPEILKKTVEFMELIVAVFLAFSIMLGLFIFFTNSKYI